MSEESQNKELSECTLIETVERLSAVNYSFDEMAVYLGLDKRAFRQQATTQDSEINLAIQRGRLMTQFEIDDKLAQNAMAGNITAAQIYKKSLDEAEFQRIKDRVYG